MATSRDQLKQLMKDLQMPMAPEEVDEHLVGLSDEEVENLLTVYQDMRDTELEVAQAALEADPKKFDQTESDYRQQAAKVEEEYSQQMERLQEQEDHELDKLDLQADKQLTALLHKQQVENNELDEAHKEIYSKLTSALLKPAGQAPATN